MTIPDVSIRTPGLPVVGVVRELLAVSVGDVASYVVTAVAVSVSLRIITEAGDPLITEASEYLYTE